jgi:hypothetical protein
VISAALQVNAVVFIDAISVKIPKGQVADRPVYLALGVTLDSERDVLGLWARELSDSEVFGCGSCPISRTAPSGTCACWSATASRACLTR